MKKSGLLIVFVKNAVAGRVKTRLAAAIGEEAALTVYKSLLRHTLEVSRCIEADKMVFYSDAVEDNDEWKQHGFQQQLQRGEDLGERMLNAFHCGQDNGYTRMIIIGSDCLELTSAILQDAFTALLDHDIVIGPARDGGYYLLGMKEIHAPVFQNKHWSTARVLEETIRDIKRKRLQFFSLPLLGDIDEVGDLPASWRERGLFELKV